jgi:hypothetical protein
LVEGGGLATAISRNPQPSEPVEKKQPQTDAEADQNRINHIGKFLNFLPGLIRAIGVNLWLISLTVYPELDTGFDGNS